MIINHKALSCGESLPVQIQIQPFTVLAIFNFTVDLDCRKPDRSHLLFSLLHSPVSLHAWVSICSALTLTAACSASCKPTSCDCAQSLPDTHSLPSFSSIAVLRNTCITEINKTSLIVLHIAQYNYRLITSNLI